MMLGIGWRHLLARVTGDKPPVEFAVFDASGNHRNRPTGHFGEDGLLLIEPQVCLPCGGVGAVAGVAVLGQDGLNVAGEVDRTIFTANQTRRNSHQQRAKWPQKIPDELKACWRHRSRDE